MSHSFGAITPVLIALICAALLAAGSSGRAATVTIYRDTWGVPHIYGRSERAVAFAFGYAQAEDRLEALLKNYLMAEGRMAEAFGPDWIEHDYQRRFEQHAKASRERYEELPAHLRTLIEYFQAGVRQYMEEHPDEVPEWAPELEPAQVVALGRYIIFGWPMGEARAELGRRDEADDKRWSNEWAVRPERTADGCAMLCIDPHVPWDGPFRWYEARLHAPNLHVCGYAILGSPVIGLGHNRYLGWTCTTGGPDTTDVYEEQINPDDPRQYRYDGEWRDVRVEEIIIKVAGAADVVRELEWTHHGPVILREGGKAYAVKTPYLDQIGLPLQLYRMNKARNIKEFKAAVGLCQFMAQNVMYADVEGNILYIRTGRVPVRPDGFDWSRPVPGNTSASEWQELHPQSDLIQMLNPPAGWMQNCNVDPDTMTDPLPFDPDDYPGYVYNSGRGRYNPRGARASELLAANSRLSAEDAMAIVSDTGVHAVEVWQDAVANAAEGVATEDQRRELAPLLDMIIAWDGRMETENAAATLFAVWRRMDEQQRPPVDRDAVRMGQPLSQAQQRSLLKALADAGATLRRQFGTVNVPWGDVHRGRRGDRSWPLAGGNPGMGSTLRAIGTNEPEDGVMYGRGGQSCTTLVLFRPGGAESYGVTPYGQSDHPDSPHYTDQGEKLLARKQLKPTWFARSELLEHVESKKTLRVPRL
ncbi:MAG: penicillin acylase family protein [Armatimonadota bacterium]